MRLTWVSECSKEIKRAIEHFLTKVLPNVPLKVIPKDREWAFECLIRVSENTALYSRAWVIGNDLEVELKEMSGDEKVFKLDEWSFDERLVAKAFLKLSKLNIKE